MMRSVRRARIVRLAVEGVRDHGIARRRESARNQVIAWRRRFAKGGMSATEADMPRSGRKPIDAAQFVGVATQSTLEGATHWGTRKSATKLGIPDTTVLKAWKASGFKGHLVEIFKVSRHPMPVEKLEDIVGLYCPRQSTR